MTELWLAIINPRSGHRKTDEEISEIQNLLSDSFDQNIEFFVTRHMGDALAISSKRSDVAGFIAVGGDGTLFDIINGMDLKSQKLAIFPAGTGNGLARELGLYDVESALKSLSKNKAKNLDLIKVTAINVGGEQKTWFVSTTASVGYTADVVELANSSFKPLGPFCYPVTSVVQALATRPFRCRIRINRSTWKDISPTNILVNNTTFAGDFKAFPNACIDDGKADFLIARAGFFRQMLHNFSVLSNTHFYQTDQPFAASIVDFELNESRMLMLDGEIIPGILKVTFEVMPGILSMVV